MTINSRRRGVTIVDVLAAVAAIVVLLAIVLPALGRGREGSLVAASLNNLKQLNVALLDYAADFNGRQPTAVVDEFSTYGSNGSAAVNNYNAVHNEDHPPVILGQCNNSNWAFYLGPDYGFGGNYITIVPITLNPSENRFGFFQLPNTKMMHQYVGGGFYRDVFFAPNDPLALSLVEPWFDYPCEYIPLGQIGGGSKWSSYCFSPAAMFDPLVLRAPSAGGYTNPYSYADGFRSPSVAQARHPALKTRVLEHHWNQNAPENRCNPNFTGGPYDRCQPLFFNHGAASEPATLFFDGSTRLLPNAEVIAHDEKLIEQTGEGPWHRATPLGEFGYYSDLSHDGTVVNHHILTIGGILGRDTLGPKP